MALKKPTNTTEEVKQNPHGFLLESMLVGSKAIENQEAQGQQELVKSDTLPSRIDADSRKVLLDAGCVFLGPVEGDSLFQYVRLPEGWSKRAMDHDMWNELLDEKGRVRATFFYKAAFYDRDAFLRASLRYTCRQEYDRWKKTGECTAIVLDGSTVIFTTEVRNVKYGSQPDRYWEAGDEALNEARRWLDEHFPKWQDAGAYWDQP